MSCIGLDVHRESCEVAVAEYKTKQSPRTEHACARLLRRTDDADALGGGSAFARPGRR